jgi:signal transduction histidine kinase/AmiR/NasT family two-component response regulator
VTRKSIKIGVLGPDIDAISGDVGLICAAFKYGEGGGVTDPWELEIRTFSEETECLRFLRAESGGVLFLPWEIQAVDDGEVLRRFLAPGEAFAVILLTSSQNETSDVQKWVGQGVQDVINIASATQQQIRSNILNAIERARFKRDLVSESRQRSDFLARMSHEIRTPITSIIGFAEVLLDRELRNDERENAASTILRNSTFLLSLVDDVLDFSRIEAGGLPVNIELVSLPMILADVYELLNPRAVEKGLRLIIEPMFPLPMQIETDAIRLEQILLNLGGNAIKFSFEGVVKITAHFDVETNKLIFRVKDTGIGIESSRISRLFDPFVQADNTIRRDFGGSGLGLAICRSLTEALGGEISARSDLGRGSEFSFMIDAGNFSKDELHSEFPKVVIAGERSGAGGATPVLPKFKGRVLVVEDVKDTQDLLNFYLRRSGISCEVASNGSVALDLFESQDFDLVLMDMHMPVMDGFAAVQYLRKKGFSRPIVAFTASATEESRRRCLEVGCDSLLTKPFSRESLLRVLGTYLDWPKSETLESRIETIRTDPSYLRLVDRFRDGLPGKVKSLNDAFRVRDFDKVKDLAHRLVSAEMFGFSEVSRLARTIEECSLNGDSVVLRDSIQKLGDLSFNPEYM